MTTCEVCGLRADRCAVTGDRCPADVPAPVVTRAEVAGLCAWCSGPVLAGARVISGHHPGCWLRARQAGPDRAA